MNTIQNTFRTIPAPVIPRANTFRKVRRPFLERIGSAIVGPDWDEKPVVPDSYYQKVGIGALVWLACLLALIACVIHYVYARPL